MNQCLKSRLAPRSLEIPNMSSRAAEARPRSITWATARSHLLAKRSAVVPIVRLYPQRTSSCWVRVGHRRRALGQAHERKATKAARTVRAAARAPRKTVGACERGRRRVGAAVTPARRQPGAKRAEADPQELHWNQFQGTQPTVRARRSQRSCDLCSGSTEEVSNEYSTPIAIAAAMANSLTATLNNVIGRPV